MHVRFLFLGACTFSLSWCMYVFSWCMYVFSFLVQVRFLFLGASTFSLSWCMYVFSFLVHVRFLFLGACTFSTTASSSLLIFMYVVDCTMLLSTMNPLTCTDRGTDQHTQSCYETSHWPMNINLFASQLDWM